MGVGERERERERRKKERCALDAAESVIPNQMSLNEASSLVRAAHKLT